MKKLMLLLVVLALAVAPVFGAASETAGEILGFMAPTSGQTVRLPVMLLDSAGAVVTGEAFNAAGMTVMYAKDGGSSFQAFPTFDTNNWDEIGYGLYMVIIREADGAELGLLDTIGHFYINVNTTAARGDTFTYKINVADVARDDQWTDTRAGYVDNLSAGAAALEGSITTLSGLVDDLEGRLTAARAGYLDNLSVGAVALEVTLASGLEDLLHSNWTHLYVDAGAGGAANGTTWFDAYTTIQAALTAAGDETVITVDAGTYAEAITITNNKILLRSHDWDALISPHANTVVISGSADVDTVDITGDYVTMIGFAITDHATGAENGIELADVDAASIIRCSIRAPNGQLATGIETAGSNRWVFISQVLIEGAEQYGIDFGGIDSYFHVRDCSIGVEDAAGAAIAVSGTTNDLNMHDCDLHTVGTVAEGIELGADASNSRFTRLAVRGFTAIYDDNGTDNSFVDVYDSLRYAVPGDEMDLMANALDAAAVAGTGAGEIAAAVTAGGAGITTYYAQVQRNENTASRRTVYFYATGTLPVNASISTNGGAFGNSDNAPATINGSRRKLEISKAELATRGRLMIDITTTGNVQTAIIIVDVVSFDPISEGALSNISIHYSAGTSTN